jgi:hypothetical protein
MLLFLLLSKTLEVMLDSVSAVKVPSVIGVCNKFDVPAIADIHPVSLDLAVVVPAVPVVPKILAVASLLP